MADEFFEQILLSEAGRLIYSSVVLRELQLKLNREIYEEKTRLIEREPKIIRVDILSKDKLDARKLESYYNFEISYYDLIHLSITKRLNAALVTRDELLLRTAREQGVIAEKPENITTY